MDFFFNLLIYGVFIMILGFMGKLDKGESYIESGVLAKTNFTYGILLVITGIIGVLFYNTLGLTMVFIMVLVLSSYIINIVVGMYRFYRLK